MFIPLTPRQAPGPPPPPPAPTPELPDDSVAPQLIVINCIFAGLALWSVVSRIDVRPMASASEQWSAKGPDYARYKR